jgi:hypothetical protein
MQGFLTRRGIYAAAMMTIAAIAATSSHASADDAGPADAGDDAATADATADAAGEAAAPTEDATTGTSDASGDAAVAADAPSVPGVPYAQPDGAPPGYSGGDIFQRLCIDAPTNVNYAFNVVTAPYADAASCKTATVTEGHKAVHDCYCDSCFSLVQQCDALPGCQAILKCELDSGCTDSNSCYLLPGAPCYTVISSWGTGSVATALTQFLQTCSAAATPACPKQ